MAGLDDAADQARDPDSIRAHVHRNLGSIGLRNLGPQGLGVLGPEVEDVTDLDAPPLVAALR